MVVRQTDPSHKQILLDAVSSYWQDRKTALPLAALGNILKSKGIDLAEFLQGDNLAQRLRRDFAAELVVNQSPTDAKTLGVIPRGQAGNVEEAFKALGPSETSGAPAGSAKWLPAAVRVAFGKPIPTGTRRIVTLMPRFTFVDRIRDHGPGGDELEIAEADLAQRIVGEVNATYNARVRAAAARWFEVHKIDFDQVASRNESRDPQASLLDRVIGALTEEQLKRCTLPLDVVAALRGA